MGDFKSRKFAFAIGLSAASTGIVLVNKASAPQWLELNKWIYGAYLGANTATKLKFSRTKDGIFKLEMN